MAPEQTAPVASLTLLRLGSLEKGAGREEGPQNRFHSPVGVNGLAWGSQERAPWGCGLQSPLQGSLGDKGQGQRTWERVDQRRAGWVGR